MLPTKWISRLLWSVAYWCRFAVSDYEIIDLFNWQNSVRDMISQIEFVRMVDVQSETVERYIKDGKVKPDLSIPFGDKRMFHYFREESIRNIAKQYG